MMELITPCQLSGNAADKRCSIYIERLRHNVDVTTSPDCLQGNKTMLMHTTITLSNQQGCEQ